MKQSPVAIARLVFFTLGFNEEGVLDSAKHRRQMRALVENVLALPSPATHDPGIIDARDRFIAAGGKWKPAHKLARLICAAALEKTGCRRL